MPQRLLMELCILWVNFYLKTCCASVSDINSVASKLCRKKHLVIFDHRAEIYWNWKIILLLEQLYTNIAMWWMLKHLCVCVYLCEWVCAYSRVSVCMHVCVCKCIHKFSCLWRLMFVVKIIKERTRNILLKLILGSYDCLHTHMPQTPEDLIQQFLHTRQTYYHGSIYPSPLFVILKHAFTKLSRVV